MNGDDDQSTSVNHSATPYAITDVVTIKGPFDVGGTPLCNEHKELNGEVLIPAVPWENEKNNETPGSLPQTHHVPLRRLVKDLWAFEYFQEIEWQRNHLKSREFISSDKEYAETIRHLIPAVNPQDDLSILPTASLFYGLKGQKKQKSGGLTTQIPHSVLLVSSSTPQQQHNSCSISTSFNAFTPEMAEELMLQKQLPISKHAVLATVRPLRRRYGDFSLQKLNKDLMLQFVSTKLTPLDKKDCDSKTSVNLIKSSPDKEDQVFDGSSNSTKPLINKNERNSNHSSHSVKSSDISDTSREGMQLAVTTSTPKQLPCLTAPAVHHPLLGELLFHPLIPCTLPTLMQRLRPHSESRGVFSPVSPVSQDGQPTSSSTCSISGGSGNQHYNLHRNRILFCPAHHDRISYPQSHYKPHGSMVHVSRESNVINNLDPPKRSAVVSLTSKPQQPRNTTAPSLSTTIGSGNTSSSSIAPVWYWHKEEPLSLPALCSCHDEQLFCIWDKELKIHHGVCRRQQNFNYKKLNDVNWSAVTEKKDFSSFWGDIASNSLRKLHYCLTCGGLHYIPYSFIEICLNRDVPSLSDLVQKLPLPLPTEASCDGLRLTACLVARTWLHEWLITYALRLAGLSRTMRVYHVCSVFVLPFHKFSEKNFSISPTTANAGDAALAPEKNICTIQCPCHNLYTIPPQSIPWTPCNEPLRFVQPHQRRPYCLFRRAPLSGDDISVLPQDKITDTKFSQLCWQWLKCQRSPSPEVSPTTRTTNNYPNEAPVGATTSRAPYGPSKKNEDMMVAGEPFSSSTSVETNAKLSIKKNFKFNQLDPLTVDSRDGKRKQNEDNYICSNVCHSSKQAVLSPSAVISIRTIAHSNKDEQVAEQPAKRLKTDIFHEAKELIEKN